MVKGRTSVIIPARNEAHLQRTIDDILSKAAGDIEVIPIVDGRSADGTFPPVREDPRVRPIWKDVPEGMRPGINDGARAATGEFLMKCDGHVIVGPGFDEILKADCDYDWLVVPTRHSIDTDTWTIKPRDFNYSALTYPFLPSMYGEGFHAVTFPSRQNREINASRAHFAIDDILAAQGSLWFQRLEYFLSFPPLDHERMYFYQENQEVTLRVLATGGRSVVNKKTFYGHWHKGKESQGFDGRPGRGFYLDNRKKMVSEAWTVKWCLEGWPAEWGPTTRTFGALIEQHWWLISQITEGKHAWPADWFNWEKYRRAFVSRPPEQIPPHT